jgi:sterol desaturase/sphingolipid hydroxylase (fatty acid hydroxylase superfamily)
VGPAARAFAISFFPLLLGATLAGAVLAMQRGAGPDAATAAPLLIAAGLILGLERVFPRFRSWLRSHGDVAVDLAHLVSVTAVSRAVPLLVVLAALPATGWLAQRTGGGPWPAHWPWLAQLGLAALIAELMQYWLHRLMHERDALWRFHATHHSAPRLYFLNAARFHPIDVGLDTFVGLLPLVLLGCPAQVLALFGLFTALVGYLQHSNLDLRLGPLNYLFSMAELHRWHHSKNLAQSNANYGSNLIIWDLVFGTFYWPRDREPPEEIGIPDLPGFPMTYWRQLASPFRWRAIRAAGSSRRRRAASDP